MRCDDDDDDGRSISKEEESIRRLFHPTVRQDSAGQATQRYKISKIGTVVYGKVMKPFVGKYALDVCFLYSQVHYYYYYYYCYHHQQQHLYTGYSQLHT